MEYTKKQFFADVEKEADALKEIATDIELSKLDFVTFRPTNAKRCIYGQMTGDCFSERASVLIYNCCKRYFKTEMGGESLEDASEEIFAAIEYVNGEIPEGVLTADHMVTHRQRAISHFSSIEAYIMQPEAQNKNLIDYLKGERKDLIL